MFKKVNIAVQIIPFSKEKEIYALVDEAIRVIQESGLVYKVCPFETVIEGDYEEIMQVIKNAQKAVLDAGASEVIVNLKIQNNKYKDVHIDDKIMKYN